MLEQLKEAVCRANVELTERGVVIYTWGNVSGIDRSAGVMVIKPSGVVTEQLRPDNMVLVNLADGAVVEGNLRPSSDTPTHLELYRAWPTIGGVAHTHSTYASAWAQARIEIPPLGTTHADFANGPIPCTRLLTNSEINKEYEANIGRVIVERFRDLNPLQIPAVLVSDHGPFIWGASPAEALYNAVILEEIAQLASETVRVDPGAKAISKTLLTKHFTRKHGPSAYYGQPPDRQ